MKEMTKTLLATATLVVVCAGLALLLSKRAREDALLEQPPLSFTESNVPAAGDRITLDGFRFSVVEKTQNAMQLMRVTENGVVTVTISDRAYLYFKYGRSAGAYQERSAP